MARSNGGRWSPKPPPGPPPASCANAVPASKTPAIAIPNFIADVPFIPFLLVSELRGSPVQFPALARLLRLIHHLRQRFQRARNLARYIAVHFGQQSLIRYLRPRLLLAKLLLLLGRALLGGNPRLLHPVMPLQQSAAHRHRQQRASQSPAQRQPPAPLPDLMRSRARTAIHRLAPRMNAALEILQRQLQILLVRRPLFQLIRFVVEFHHYRFPPSSSRTLATARERCAFTVPSLNPVAAAISLSSRSSTYRSRNTVRCLSLSPFTDCHTCF